MTSTILITGATAGLGRHAALYLAQQGHHVIATGRKQDALDKLATAAKGLRLDVVRLDVTDQSSIDAAVAEVDELTDGRGIDALVNNAGYGQFGPLEHVPESAFRAQFETNVFGLMNVTRAFLPKMKARREGRIVNVSSVGGRVTFPLAGAYHATKYAVEALSDALRQELAMYGIKVVIVEPGPIKSEFANRVVDGIDVLEGIEGTPWEKVLSTVPEQQAKAIRMSADPIVVSRAVEKAVVRRRPRARYTVPFLAAFAMRLLQLLPAGLADAIFRRAIGVHRPVAPPALVASTV